MFFGALFSTLLWYANYCSSLSDLNLNKRRKKKLLNKLLCFQWFMNIILCFSFVLSHSKTIPSMNEDSFRSESNFILFSEFLFSEIRLFWIWFWFLWLFGYFHNQPQQPTDFVFWCLQQQTENLSHREKGWKTTESVSIEVPNIFLGYPNVEGG